jgi:hypothetical protein
MKIVINFLLRKVEKPMMVKHPFVLALPTKEAGLNSPLEFIPQLIIGTPPDSE